MIRIRQISLAAVVVGAALAMTPSASAAGSVNQGTIANIQVVTTNGVAAALLNFVGGVGGTRPSCAVFPQLGMGIDSSTAKGKAVLTVAMAAWIANKKVTVNGSGTCFGTSNSIEIIDSITAI